jgi:hypothetical protein
VRTCLNPKREERKQDVAYVGGMYGISITRRRHGNPTQQTRKIQRMEVRWGINSGIILEVLTSSPYE